MTSPVSIEQSMRNKIEVAFDPVYFELENESHSHSVPANSETHFKLILVADLFAGKSRIDRQRLVQDLFHEERTRGLHALTLRVFTPDEWDLVKDTFEMASPACRGGSRLKANKV
jgi:BolA protein